MIRIAIIITVHNRIDKTLACLDSLYGQKKNDDKFIIQTYLTDDGSTDGTAKIIRETYPSVRILNGNGNLYWNGGMRLAFSRAMEEGYDHYLWINNDTTLFDDAIDRLLSTSFELNDEAIIVGSTKDPATYEWSYGGVVRKDRIRPFKFIPVLPDNYPKSVDTMNGNCVLIPQKVADVVGNLDQIYTHTMGDRDYGLRAKEMGISIYISPGYYGYCERNSPIDYPRSIKKALKIMLSKKVLPPKEYAYYSKKHAGKLWPIYFLSPYIKKILELIINFIKMPCIKNNTYKLS